MGLSWTKPEFHTFIAVWVCSRCSFSMGRVVVAAADTHDSGLHATSMRPLRSQDTATTFRKSSSWAWALGLRPTRLPCRLAEPRTLTLARAQLANDARICLTRLTITPKTDLSIYRQRSKFGPQCSKSTPPQQGGGFGLQNQSEPTPIARDPSTEFGLRINLSPPACRGGGVGLQNQHEHPPEVPFRRLPPS